MAFVGAMVVTGLAGNGLCAEMPSTDQPSAATVTYTPIIRGNSATPSNESPSTNRAAPPQAHRPARPQAERYPDPSQGAPPLGSDVAPTASAMDTPDSDEGVSPIDHASTTSLMFNLGLGSPVGLVGGTFTYSPWAQFQAELGLGLGASGWQFSAMIKLLGVEGAGRRFVLGVGPSVGIDRCQGCIAYWLNAEAGYETRSQGGSSFLFAFGVVGGLAGKMPGYRYPAIGENEPGEPVPPESVSHLVYPEFRVAWGHWWK
jgi:hypothetical protein